MNVHLPKSTCTSGWNCLRYSICDVAAGVTLRENNLKQLEGGLIMKSQGVLVASKRALETRPGLLEVVHELIERFEAHLTAEDFYSVTANMVRGPTCCSTLSDDDPVLK